jgi:hypothetical protein
MLQAQLLRKERPDRRAPPVVPLIAPDVSQANVVSGEVTPGEPWDRVVIGRGRPRPRRMTPLVEVPTALRAVTLRHLAAEVVQLTPVSHLEQDPSGDPFALKALATLLSETLPSVPMDLTAPLVRRLLLERRCDRYVIARPVGRELARDAVDEPLRERP